MNYASIFESAIDEGGCWYTDSKAINEKLGKS